jgi:VIT1/CCC1 family predicted Fe2+/Mn2+ transporter
VREFAERAVAQAKGPHVPDTPERTRLERERSVRELVFGMQDGILTTLGIVTGVGAAQADRTTILLTGIVSLIVGAASMGVGEYVGGKSEREVVRNAIELEKREMAANPEDEFAEQVAYYRLKGFTPEEATMIVRRLATNPGVWLHEMMRDEFGIDPRIAEESGSGSAFVMAGSFAVGAFIPLIPHIFTFGATLASGLAMALAALALFSIGVFTARLSGRNPIRKGCELVGFGALVFAISYGVGHFLPALFGRAPVIGA